MEPMKLQDGSIDGKERRGESDSLELGDGLFLLVFKW